MVFCSENIEPPDKEITNNKSESVGESVPGWSYMETVKWNIENMHMNILIIQHQCFSFCEGIFFDF